jgi:uncharacterized protein
MTLGDEKYLRLTTFRRNGNPVATPVWAVALDGGEVGFYTSSTSGKVKRLAHTSRVLVQPSDSRGKPRAGTSEVEATARLVTGPELEEIRRRIVAKYGFMTKVTKVLAKLGGIVKRRKQPYADRGVVVTLT